MVGARLGSVRARLARLRHGFMGDGDPPWAARRSGRVYLTFDDGPDPEWTPRVLDELARLDVQASFFVLGERVRRAPELIERMLREGHDVELHGWGHARQTTLSREELAAETDRALDALVAAGAHPTRWRPPYGIGAWWALALANERGLRLTGASCDPRDWSDVDVDQMLANMDPDLRAGRVVVMHDSLGPGNLRSTPEPTVALLEPLVERIRARGLKPAPLREGAAFWWLRTPAMAADTSMDASLSFELVEEDDLEGEDRRAVNELLATEISRDKELYRERGWRKIRPAYRVLARDDGEIVGSISVMPLRTEPPLQAFGHGDAVIRADQRGRGIGGNLQRIAIMENLPREPELIMGDTTALAGMGSAVGFRVERFSMYYEHDGACHWHPNWLAWLSDPQPGRRIRLEEGDF